MTWHTHWHWASAVVHVICKNNTFVNILSYLFRWRRTEASGTSETTEKQKGHVLRCRYSAVSFSAQQVVPLRAVYLWVCIYVDLRVKCLYLTVNLCFLSSPNSGTDRESPNNVEKPPNRKPPVKKPRLPQNRNKSLDLSGTCLCFFFVCVRKRCSSMWLKWTLEHRSESY